MDNTLKSPSFRSINFSLEKEISRKRVSSEPWALICSAQRTEVIDIKKDPRLFIPAMTAKWPVTRRFCEGKLRSKDNLQRERWEQRSYVVVWRSHLSGYGLLGFVDGSHLASAIKHYAGCPKKLRECPLDDRNSSKATQPLLAGDGSLSFSKIPIIQKGL